ncbi:interleukin 21 receptor, tandem duplicate 2 [Brachyhypopomus gauderio]|uniref:interleukin 21 receptor, tandem duplicate 2 n=1 Tax=Brachyhypopomus gauderio TaxID=698409 RepID=UPI0040418818
MILQLEVLCTFLTISRLSKAQSSAQDHGLTCETSYWLTIDCFLNSSVITSGTENDSHWLEFHYFKMKSKPMGTFNCSLLIGKDLYTCSFTAKPKAKFQEVFMNVDYFKIILCSMENGHKKSRQLDSAYYPAKHIKPITPHNITMQYAKENYTFRWISGYEKHTYVEALPFQYIFSYHKEGQADEALTVITGKQPILSIPEHSLDPDSTYIAQICCDVIPNTYYNGTKSLWSFPINWTTSIYSKETSILNTWNKIIFPICLAVILTFLLAYPVASMIKIKVITGLSTPTPYLKSLHYNDNGHFQGKGLKGHMQEICYEEISTIDMIVELTAVEEDQQMTCNTYCLAQCSTPYVGPSADVWGPFKKQESSTDVGISSTDINFLPGQLPGEEFRSCLHTDNEAIALLSLADLELSHDISSSPDALTPKLACFTQNYCTLTNTATGLIPTFSTGPNGPGLVAADTQTTTDPLKSALEDNTEVAVLTLDNLQLSLEE